MLLNAHGVPVVNPNTQGRMFPLFATQDVQRMSWYKTCNIIKQAVGSFDGDTVFLLGEEALMPLEE